MKRKFNLIPFFLTKISFKTSGIEKEIEKIKYNFEASYERDSKILDIKHSDKKSKEYLLDDLQLKYHYKMISKNEYQKELHTLNDKPYVDVINSGFVTDENGRGQMMFEFDWNHQFVQYLKKEGYGGFTPDEIVDNWFTDVCEQNARTNYLYGPD